MRELRFRAEAEADLSEIFATGAELFGRDVAEAWRDGLANVLERLCEFPEIGRARPDLAPGLRGWSYRRHMLLYLVSDTSIDVVRVLHQRMDATRHL